jgi:hypothetical protein
MPVAAFPFLFVAGLQHVWPDRSSICHAAPGDHRLPLASRKRPLIAFPRCAGAKGTHSVPHAPSSSGRDSPSQPLRDQRSNREAIAPDGRPARRSASLVGMKAGTERRDRMDVAATRAHLAFALLRCIGPWRRCQTSPESRVSPACTVQSLCLSEGSTPDALSQVDDLVTARIRLHKGDTLFRAVSVSSRSMRSSLAPQDDLADEDGRDQVSGYHMSGESSHRRHRRDRYACQRWRSKTPSVRTAVRQAGVVSGASTCASSTTSTGCCRGRSSRSARSMPAGDDARGAAACGFLSDLADRYHARAIRRPSSAPETREEIGSYLS